MTPARLVAHVKNMACRASAFDHGRIVIALQDFLEIKSELRQAHPLAPDSRLVFAVGDDGRVQLSSASAPCVATLYGVEFEIVAGPVRFEPFVRLRAPVQFVKGAL